MNLADWTNLVAAISAVVGVLLPIAILWLEKRGRLARAAYLIRLHKTHSELKALLAASSDEPRTDRLTQEAEKVLGELDKEIEGRAKARPSHSFRVFVGLATLEAFLFIGAGFFEYSDFLRRFLKAESSESGLLFLEGIWSAVAARGLLWMVVVATAMALTLRYAPSLARRDGSIGSAIGDNLILMVFFNAFIVAVGGIAAVILKLSDPISPFW